MKCPREGCTVDVVLTAHKNGRNDKWTVLPLEEAGAVGEFRVFPHELHEAVDISGDVVGEFPISAFLTPSDKEATYRTHSPSHFLDPEGHGH